MSNELDPLSERKSMMLYSQQLMDPEHILSILTQFEQEHPEHHGITFSTRQYFFADPMIPSQSGKPAVGNKFAFERFIEKMQPGYYVSMDTNDFKYINKLGHDVGDITIKKIGHALRNATQHISRSKLFRSGGDEFLLYCETLEHAFHFIEHAIAEIGEIDIGHDIVITLSFGVGTSYKEAEAALLKAKDRKTSIPNNIVYHLRPSNDI
jgi:hypothetical protein